MSVAFSHPSARRIVVLVLVALVASVVLSVLPPRAAAQVTVVDAVSDATAFFLNAYYFIVLGASDCVEVLLYHGPVLADALDLGCGVAGDAAFGSLFAEVAPGGYTLDVRSTSSGNLLGSRSWLLPAVTMTVSPPLGTVSTGELVGVTATFSLAVDGPDAYFRRGTLTVASVSAFSTQVAIEILSARYLAFFGLNPVSDFETYSTTVPIAFGAAGTTSVTVTFDDTIHSLSRTTSVVVWDPNKAAIDALEDEVAELREELNRSKSRVAQLEASGASVGSVLPIAALALGIVGVLVAILALRATRRIRPPVPPGPPMPRAPTPSVMPSEVPPAAPFLPESPHPRMPEPPPQGGGGEAQQSGSPDEL